MHTDVSSVVSLDTLHATDGLVDAIPDTIYCLAVREYQDALAVYTWGAQRRYHSVVARQSRMQ